MTVQSPAFKRPESVLVVVHSPDFKFLLIERTQPSGFWQSVTGSLLWPDETPRKAAHRELGEETGISARSSLVDWRHVRRFPIHPMWRTRYHPDAIFNVEHMFSVCIQMSTPVRLNHREHGCYGWYDPEQALLKVSSWTNREAIEQILESAKR